MKIKKKKSVIIKEILAKLFFTLLFISSGLILILQINTKSDFRILGFVFLGISAIPLFLVKRTIIAFVCDNDFLYEQTLFNKIKICELSEIEIRTGHEIESARSTAPVKLGEVMMRNAANSPIIHMITPKQAFMLTDHIFENTDAFVAKLEELETG